MARNKVIVIEAIALVILIVTALIVWINLTLKEDHGKPREPPLTASQGARFGINTQAHIYINNMEAGARTEYGRLK